MTSGLAGLAWKRYVRAYVSSRKMSGLDPDWRRAMRRAFMAGWRARDRFESAPSYVGEPAMCRECTCRRMRDVRDAIIVERNSGCPIHGRHRA